MLEKRKIYLTPLLQNSPHRNKNSKFTYIKEVEELLLLNQRGGKNACFALFLKGKPMNIKTETIIRRTEQPQKQRNTTMSFVDDHF